MGAMYLQPPTSGTEKKRRRREREDEEEEEEEGEGEGDGSPGFDFKKALAHFRVAAKAGHVQAMHKLGQMIVHGIGVDDQETTTTKTTSERRKKKKKRRRSGDSTNVSKQKRMKKKMKKKREKRRLARCEEAVNLFKKVSERGSTSLLISQAESWHKSGKYAASLWWVMFFFFFFFFFFSRDLIFLLFFFFFFFFSFLLCPQVLRKSCQRRLRDLPSKRSALVRDNGGEDGSAPWHSCSG
jgi:hypothetical protein